MEVHRIPLALRLLPRIRQRVICFHLRECASYGAWAGMQAFMVFSCIDLVGKLLLACDSSPTNSSLLHLQKGPFSCQRSILLLSHGFRHPNLPQQHGVLQERRLLPHLSILIALSNTPRSPLSIFSQAG